MKRSQAEQKRWGKRKEQKSPKRKRKRKRKRKEKKGIARRNEGGSSETNTYPIEHWEKKEKDAHYSIRTTP